MSSTEFSQLNVVHIGRVRDKLIAVPRDASAEEHYYAEVEALRSSLFSYPDDTAGLDISRINEARDALNAPLKPLLFLSDKDFGSALSLFEHTSPDSDGYYSAALGLLLVRRNIELESLNGPAITESFAIHEIGHSDHIETPVRAIHTTTGRFLWKKKIIQIEKPSSGFAIIPLRGPHQYGAILEEGQAELERGLFVEQHDLVGAFTSGAENYRRTKQSPIPLRYWYKHEKDGRVALTMTPGAILGTVLSKLIEHEPELLADLRKSKKTVAGRRDFVQHVNSFMPGLYSRLMHADKDSSIKLLVEVNKKF